jgi:phosphoserine phosphatase
MTLNYPEPYLDVTNVRGLVGFDLDGTLLRGRTVCELLAEPLGRASEMVRIEGLCEERDIAEGRLEMAEWYKGHSIHELRGHLREATWAPGAHEAVQKLHSAGIVVAIASYTWSFAVQWFAEQLDVSHHLGTQLRPEGEIHHVWGRDKATWLLDIASNHGVQRERIAAVGDTRGDAEMLCAAGLPFFVGVDPLSGIDALVHMPRADLREVADHILSRWIH